MIQDQSESISERGNDGNLYLSEEALLNEEAGLTEEAGLSEEAGLTPLLGKIQSFEDCDWLVVLEGNKIALLGSIISLHFEMTCIIFPVFTILSLSHTHICIYILYLPCCHT